MQVRVSRSQNHLNGPWFPVRHGKVRLRSSFHWRRGFLLLSGLLGTARFCGFLTCRFTRQKKFLMQLLGSKLIIWRTSLMVFNPFSNYGGRPVSSPLVTLVGHIKSASASFSRISFSYRASKCFTLRKMKHFSTQELTELQPVAVIRHSRSRFSREF